MSFFLLLSFSVLTCKWDNMPPWPSQMRNKNFKAKKRILWHSPGLWSRIIRLHRWAVRRIRRFWRHQSVLRWSFLGLSKGGKLRANPSWLTIPYLGFVGGLLHGWRKETVNVLKGKEVQVDVVSWKLWEKNRREHQGLRPLKPHRYDRKISSQSKRKKTRKLKHQK